MTKRIAAVTIALGLPLMLFGDHEPTPDAPLDVAWHFCSCEQPVFGNFRSAPIRINEWRDVREVT